MGLKKINIKNNNDIIELSNIKKLFAKSKKTKRVYNIEPCNAWRYPLINIKKNNFTDTISIDFLVNNYDILEEAKKTYQQRKKEAREKILDTLNDIREKNLAWYDWAHLCDTFEKIGKRYGLLRELKENGVI